MIMKNVSFFLIFLGFSLISLFAEENFKYDPLCAYKKDSLWYFLDHEGNELFEPKNFTDVRGYSEGKIGVEFLVDYRPRWAYMDLEGNLLFGKDFDMIQDFHEGMAVVMKFTDLRKSNVQYGLIDSTGKQVLPFEFDDMSRCSDGWIYAKKGNKFCYYDKTGKEVLDIGNLAGSHFSEGRAVVSNISYKMGYIDKTGKVVIPTAYEEAAAFSEGLAAVTTEGMTGYCNKDGKIIIEPKFENVTEFSENRAFIGLMNKDFKTMWGMIDNKGNIINRLIYDEVFNFNEGLAAVSKKGKWGFIHPHGEFILEPKYSYALSFYNGIAWVSEYENKKWGYIDQTFEYVVEIPEFDKLIDLRMNKRVFK
jgi:hypothetical protein